MMDEEPLRRFNANNDKAVDRQIVFNFFFSQIDRIRTKAGT